VIIDTTVLVDLLRGSSQARSFLTGVPLEGRSISAVTVAELVKAAAIAASLPSWNESSVSTVSCGSTRLNRSWPTVGTVASD
jgi:predicted nucleic acid-binding protein